MVQASFHKFPKSELIRLAQVDGSYLFTTNAPDDFYIGIFMKERTVRLPKIIALRTVNLDAYPDIKISGSELHACALRSNYLRRFLPRVYLREVGPFIITLMNSITSGAVEKVLNLLQEGIDKDRKDELSKSDI